MIHRIALLALLSCVLPAVGFAHGAHVVPLTAAEVPSLLKPPARGQRIIMLWALDCVYCEPNMQALAKAQRAHPADIQFMTVATDDVASARQSIRARLNDAGMQDFPARAYATAATAQMNFLIDPNWGGETPRTLIIRSDGTRMAVSGELTRAQLRRLQP